MGSGWQTRASGSSLRADVGQALRRYELGSAWLTVAVQQLRPGRPRGILESAPRDRPRDGRARQPAARHRKKGAVAAGQPLRYEPGSWRGRGHPVWTCPPTMQGGWRAGRQRGAGQGLQARKIRHRLGELATMAPCRQCRQCRARARLQLHAGAAQAPGGRLAGARTVVVLTQGFLSAASRLGPQRRGETACQRSAISASAI